MKNLIDDKRWDEAAIVVDDYHVTYSDKSLVGYKSPVGEKSVGGGENDFAAASAPEGTREINSKTSPHQKPQSNQDFTEDSMTKPSQDNPAFRSLEGQRGVLYAQYAEVAMRLRELEAKERELNASLRLIFDQIRLSQTTPADSSTIE